MIGCPYQKNKHTNTCDRFNLFASRATKLNKVGEVFAIEIGEVVAFSQKVFGSGESRMKLDIVALKSADFCNHFNVFEKFLIRSAYNAKAHFVFVKMTIAIVNGVMLHNP